jgi:outer membrane protein OmpA-like peptidoglycan-associated protein
MRKFMFLLLVMTGSLQLSAQVVTTKDASKKAIKELERGITFAMGQQFDDALAAFEKAIDAEPGFISAWIFAGDVCMETKQYEKARSFFAGAIDLQDDYDVSVYKKIAQCEQYLMEYDAAIEHINLFLEHPAIVGETRRKALLLLESLEFAADAVNHPLDFRPENMGPAINSRFDEYFPSLSADQSILVYTRNVVDTTTTNTGTVILKGNEDFYISESVDTYWGPGYNIGSPVNTSLNEGAQNISADGRWLFYTLCNGPNGYGSCDIYYAYQFEGTWSYPENCGKRINSAKWDSQPSISADGNELYFVSNRPGGQGGSDIWMSRMGEDGYWQAAVNLGPGINTPEEENSPFIHPDGNTLYFASNGRPGMGGTDLFYARRNADLGWESPVNLGYPLNTGGNEATLHVSADGQQAYYSSDREDSFGGLDIYSFPLPDQLRPQPVTYVKATVLNGITRQPLEADIQLFNLAAEELIVKSKSDPNTGQFLVILPSGQDFGLYVNKEGYLFNSQNFSLAEGIPDAPYLLTVLLQPVSVGEIITLRNVFFESASSDILAESAVELNKLYELLLNNPSMKVAVKGHTDAVGSETDNQTLSENRAQAVVAYLEEKGINPARMTAIGYGESAPIAENDTDEGRALNRRTEIEIISL